MPYVDNRARLSLDEGGHGHPATTGELNYAITKLILEYLGSKPVNYDCLNAVVGVLECAKLELYRRVVVPYEECKRAENGDVYE